MSRADEFTDIKISLFLCLQLVTEVLLTSVYLPFCWLKDEKRAALEYFNTMSQASAALFSSWLSDDA